MSGGVAGVVTASVPPGTSTRRVSEHVLDRLGAQHEVEGAVVEWERRVGLQHREARIRQPLPGARQRHGRDVGSGQRARVELRREPPVTAAEVESAPRAPERAHELAQVLGRWPRIGRHELPQLVVVAARHGRSA
jgi:hypothetical protein